MNCTPEKCPHRALMEKARAACLACDHTVPAGHGGTISADAAGERIVQREKLHIDRSPRGQVTSLPAEVEEKLADLIRIWVGLDSIDALLMLHVANGGTTNNFGAYLARVHDAIGKMNPTRDNFRATAWAKFKSLMKRFAPYLRGKLHAWDDGHGGAIASERRGAEAREAQGDLFAFHEGGWHD